MCHQRRCCMDCWQKYNFNNCQFNILRDTGIIADEVYFQFNQVDFLLKKKIRQNRLKVKNTCLSLYGQLNKQYNLNFRFVFLELQQNSLIRSQHIANLNFNYQFKDLSDQSLNLTLSFSAERIKIQKRSPQNQAQQKSDVQRQKNNYLSRQKVIKGDNYNYKVKRLEWMLLETNSNTFQIIGIKAKSNQTDIKNTVFLLSDQKQYELSFRQTIEKLEHQRKQLQRKQFYKEQLLIQVSSNQRNSQTNKTQKQELEQKEKQILELKQYNAQLKQRAQELNQANQTLITQTKNKQIQYVQKYRLSVIIGLLLICFTCFASTNLASNGKISTQEQLKCLKDRLQQIQKILFDKAQKLQIIKNQEKILEYIREVYENNQNLVQKNFNINKNRQKYGLKSIQAKAQIIHGSNDIIFGGVDLTQNGYYFIHRQKKIQNFEELIKRFSWKNVYLVENDWRMFVENGHLFENLKILNLASNSIEQFKQGDIDRFKNLKDLRIDNNSFDPESQQNIIEYKKNHPKFILYGTVNRTSKYY